MTGSTLSPARMRGPLAALAWLAVLAQICLFGAPLLLIVWLSLQGPPDTPITITPAAWITLLASPEARWALLNSMMLAALSALMTTICAIPLAYLIAIRGGRSGRITLGFVIMMWFIDPGMRILGWMQAFKDLALLDVMPLILVNGWTAELIAAVHAWLPVPILGMAIGFARVERPVLDAARECGATGTVLVRRILWPLNHRLAALMAAIVFCGSIGSFLEPRLLGNGDFQQASEWLQRALESETGWPYAAGMLLLMLIVAILPLLLVLGTQRRGQRIAL
jgi:putative spermidine/putrescine transport system permease protein